MMRSVIWHGLCVLCVWVFAFSAAAGEVSLDESRVIEEFEFQRAEVWCWAACIELCLRYSGVEISQAEIVQRTFGQTGNFPAGWVEMTRNLNGIMRDADGRRVMISGNVFQGAPTPEAIINHLRSDQPIILAFRIPSSGIGHAVLVTGVEYEIINDRAWITQVVIRDPFPYDQMHVENGGRVVVSSDHPVFQFITNIWLVRASIEDE